MPRLIINADDLGYSKERDEGIIKCIQEGIVTSTSLLVNGANASRILPYAIESDISVGLHINLTEGIPVSPLEHVASLVVPRCLPLTDTFLSNTTTTTNDSKKDKYTMRGKMGFRTALENGEINMEHIRNEIFAQYNQFLTYASSSTSSLPSVQSVPVVDDDNNDDVSIVSSSTSKNKNTATTVPTSSSVSSKYYPSHWDGHQHIHVLKTVQPIVQRLFHSMVPYTRVPKLGPDREFLAFLPRDRQIFYDSIDRDSRSAENLWQNKNLLTIDQNDIGSIRNPSIFIGYTTMGKDCQLSHVKELLQAAINDATEPNDTIEWMVHPGYRTRKRSTTTTTVSSSSSSSVMVSFSKNDNDDDDAGCGQGPDDFAMSEDREIEMNLLLDKNHSLRNWLQNQDVTLISYRDL